MSIRLNAFGEGLMGGVRTGAAISQHNRETEQWDMYKSRLAETDATQAMVTTLADGYGGDVDAMLNDAVGQQIAFDFIKTNDTVRNALESNKGWTPAAMMSDDKGSFVVMMRNGDGDTRPLTIDRKSGTEPLRLGREDVYKLMGASAAKLGITNNPQMMRYVDDLVGGDSERANTYLGADVSTTIPSAPALGVVAATTRNQNGSGVTVPQGNAPKIVYTGGVAGGSEVAEEVAPTKAPESKGVIPAKIEPKSVKNDTKEMVDERYNASLSSLVEGGHNSKDLPSSVKNGIANEQKKHEVNLDELSEEERAKMLGDEAEGDDPSIQVPPLEEEPELADENPSPQFANYMSSIGGETDHTAVIPPLRTKPKMDDVNPNPKFANYMESVGGENYLENMSGNTPFFDKIMNNFRREPNNGASTYKEPMYNKRDGALGNMGAPDERPLMEKVGAGTAQLGEFVGKAKNLAGEAVDYVSDAASEAKESFKKGYNGTQKPAAGSPTPDAAVADDAAEKAVSESVSRGAVRDSDFKDPAKRSKVESGIQRQVEAEQPDVRVESDARALEVLSRETRKPTSKQRYAAMRLFQSDLLPKEAYVEFLETGRLSHRAQELAVMEWNARTNYLKAKNIATRNAAQQRDYVDKRGEEAFKFAQEQYNTNVDSGTSGMLEFMSNNSPFMEYLEATEVKAEDYAKDMTNAALNMPSNVLAVTNGRTANKYEMYAHEVNMAQQATAAYMFDKWSKPKDGGWWGRDKAPVTGANAGDINLSRWLKVNE